MTIIIHNCKTKKALKAGVTSLNTTGLRPSFYFSDPSIFNPVHGTDGPFSIFDMRVGENIIVTNHPKRSFFAVIKRISDVAWKVS